MHRGLLRSTAIAFVLAWMARCLGCDASTTRPSAADTDEDGLSDVDEIAIYGTSPVLADTDGDGLSDYDEIVGHTFDPVNAPLRFNPRVADVPMMNLRISSPPTISLHLIDTKGTTITFETTTEDEVRNIVTVGQTETVTESSTVGGSETANQEVTVEEGVDPGVLIESEDEAELDEEETGEDDATEDDEVIEDEDGGPDSVLITNGASETVEASNTEGVVVSFSTEQAQEIRRMLALAQGYAETHEISASGGILQLLVEISNDGELPFQVTNLLLAGSLVTGEGVEAPIGNLEINSSYNNFQPYALGPREKVGPVVFARDFLTLDQVATLLDDLEAFTVRLGVYELTDGADKPYVFDTSTMRGRTATLMLDYAEHRRPERLLVATNLDPGWPGVTLARALRDILRIDYEANRDVGLTSVRGVGFPTSPEDAKNHEGHWEIQQRRDNGVDTEVISYTAPFDLDEILLRGGDVIRLKWVESAASGQR